MTLPTLVLGTPLTHPATPSGSEESERLSSKRLPQRQWVCRQSWTQIGAIVTGLGNPNRHTGGPEFGKEIAGTCIFGAMWTLS